VAPNVGGIWNLARSTTVGCDLVPGAALIVHAPAAGRISMMLVVPLRGFSARR
jgi:hypothetical protein